MTKAWFCAMHTTVKDSEMLKKINHLLIEMPYSHAKKSMSLCGENHLILSNTTNVNCFALTPIKTYFYTELNIQL